MTWLLYGRIAAVITAIILCAGVTVLGALLYGLRLLERWAHSE